MCVCPWRVRVCPWRELYEPFGLNDNLTIPVMSSLAMVLAFMRTRHCYDESDASDAPLQWAQLWDDGIAQWYARWDESR